MISDIFKGSPIYLEILAFNAKDQLVDRSYLYTTVPQKRNTFSITPISGYWHFERPLPLDALSVDKTIYDGIYIQPVKDVLHNESHTCFLYNIRGNVQTEICKIAFSHFDKGAHFLNSSCDQKGPTEASRMIGLDMRHYTTSIGEVGGTFSIPEVDDRLSSPWVFHEYGKAELLIAEFVIRKVLAEQTFVDHPEILTNARERFTMEMKSLPAGDWDSQKYPLEAKQVIFLDIFRQCTGRYKVFYRQGTDAKITMTLDTGDLYLYPIMVTRVEV
jgi:hypothetical protein